LGFSFSWSWIMLVLVTETCDAADWSYRPGCCAVLCNSQKFHHNSKPLISGQFFKRRNYWMMGFLFMATCLIFCLNFAGLSWPLPFICQRGGKKFFNEEDMGWYWKKIANLLIEKWLDLDFLFCFTWFYSNNCKVRFWLFIFCLFMQR